MYLYVRLNDRVHSIRSDAALVVLVSGHLGKAFFAPGGAPAVLDQPIVFTFTGSAVSHQEDAVIEIVYTVFASRIVNHACVTTILFTFTILALINTVIYKIN